MNAQGLVDADSEREVLAAAFIEPERFPVLAQLVIAADFGTERNRLIWAAICDVAANGMAIDMASVRHAMQRAGTYDRAGGMQAISESVDRVGFCINAPFHARIVREKAIERRMVSAQQRLGVAIAEHDEESFAQHMDEIHVLNRERTQVSARLELLSLHERGQAGHLTEAPPPEEPLLTWDDCGSTELLMPDGCVSMLAAAGGTGKGYAFMALAVAIATGEPWFGYKVARKGRVLLLLGEEDEKETQRRLFKAAKILGGAENAEYLYAEAARHIVPLPMMGKDVSILGRDGQPTAFHRVLMHELGKGTWRALLMDPLSRCGGPEIETDAFAATSCVRLLEQLTEVPGKPAVIVSHHTNKSAQADDAVRSQSNVRGHSALVDGPRWVGYLESLQRGKRLKGRVRMTVVKGNRGPKPDPLELKWDKGIMRPMEAYELEVERDDEVRDREEKRTARKAMPVPSAAQRVGANTL